MAKQSKKLSLASWLTRGLGMGSCGRLGDQLVARESATRPLPHLNPTRAADEFAATPVLERPRDLSHAARSPSNQAPTTGVAQSAHRFKAAVTVPSHIDTNITNFGAHRRAIVAVTRVACPAAINRVRFITEMLGDLSLQPSLKDPLNQTRQQASLAG